jgi:hypothetical protein
MLPVEHINPYALWPTALLLPLSRLVCTRYRLVVTTVTEIGKTENYWGRKSNPMRNEEECRQQSVDLSRF